MQRHNQARLLFFFILVIGIGLRFYNLNWDSHTHIHPDERFLTMVGNASQVPTLSNYFNPELSTLNPVNIGYKFFVYGTLPLTLNKLLAVQYHQDTYNDFTLLGRGLSAFFDVLTLIYVFKVGVLLEKKYRFDARVKYWATFFYAIAVLPIQLSHFFAVDTFLNFFMWAGFYFALQTYVEEKRYSLVASAAMIGAALACKISAVFILPLTLIFVVFKQLESIRLSLHKLRLWRPILQICTRSVWYLLVVYAVVRLGDPYMFQSASWLNPRPNKVFVENIKQLKTFEGKDIWYPPGIQWIKKPPLTFALKNMAVSGFGVPLFLLIIFGFYVVLKKYRKFTLHIILVWIVGFFLYQSTQFVKAVRYFIFLYPFLCIIAALGTDFLIANCELSLARLPAGITNKGVLRFTFHVFTLVAVSVWPLAFLSIYIRPHSRVQASQWIYRNIPSGSIILGELWDDPLPLQIANPENRIYHGDLLPVFDTDTRAKWVKMRDMLNPADYYILSSNRAWGSIPTVPEKYPVTTKFYNSLLNDEFSYKKIVEFTAYPSLKYLGIPLEFNDDTADESFTVYDHPKVMIFQNLKK